MRTSVPSAACCPRVSSLVRRVGVVSAVAALVGLVLTSAVVITNVRSKGAAT